MRWLFAVVVFCRSNNSNNNKAHSFVGCVFVCVYLVCLCMCMSKCVCVCVCIQSYISIDLIYLTTTSAKHTHTAAAATTQKTHPKYVQRRQLTVRQSDSRRVVSLVVSSLRLFDGSATSFHTNNEMAMGCTAMVPSLSLSLSLPTGCCFWVVATHSLAA